jgi:hypothetical protein
MGGFYAMNVHPAQGKVIYQADQNVKQTLLNKREQIQKAARSFTNQPVRIQTLDGHTYEGVIVNVDGRHVYLSVTQTPVAQRQYVNPYYSSYYYNNVILPLVLYELLVISLLYT